MKKRFFNKSMAQAVTVFCLMCVSLAVACGYQEQKANSLIPPQDGDGYYLLSTKEDFRWFISGDRDPYTNVRLANDLILNDTEEWENWADTPPENSYGAIPSYHGHFDGNGYALEGYYTSYGKWLAFLFTILEEDARVTDLTIRNSVFQTTYEDCAYKDENGKTDVIIASALCFANYGVVENCEVQAKVTGAWDAGGIVGINYGEMTDCKFTGTVEAGTDQHTQAPENTITKQSLFAGGICRSNRGSIRNCVNEGSVTIDAISETFYMHDFVVGGIAGRQSAEGRIEDSRNMGDVTGIELAGGIVGASRGSIYKCQNSGKVHIQQTKSSYVKTLISAGVCASNGGIVDTCVNTGAVTINQEFVSYFSPIYGIACNTVNPEKGLIENCFYLEEKALQVYPQRGVRKLKKDEISEFSEYFSGEKRLVKTDFTDFLGFVPYDPEKDKDDTDYVHLGFGPPEDVVYKVWPGDNLWTIAKRYYGDGRYYGNLVWKNPALEEGLLLPGMKIIVPHRDVAAVRRYDEEGFDFAYCRLPSGESCPTRFVLSKPINWYYGTMRFAANAGLETLWPKTPDAAESEDIRIFYRVDANPDGDFFEGHWLDVQERIKKSAAAYWGNSVDTFEFDHYTLAGGENLYCYSFVVYRKDEKLVCQTAYRLCENMLVEFIGVQPLDLHERIGQSHDVLLRVPYMAAFVDTGTKIEETQFDQETFYGREHWDFPQIHNPFAIALVYDKDAECIPYMLFTGAQ